jgi:hypothetical protein
MNPALLIVKWFWAFFIAASFFNVYKMKRKAARQILAHPELEEGYRAIIKGFAISTIIPWVIVGFGCLFGGMRSIFDVFQPRFGNPFVLAFHVSIILETLLGTNWIVFRGGAEMLAKHPGIFNYDVRSPRMVILLWFLGVAGTIFGEVMIFSGMFPPPPSF